MTYEKPEMIKLVVVTEKSTAMGPDGCSVKWSGCCYKE